MIFKYFFFTRRKNDPSRQPGYFEHLKTQLFKVLVTRLSRLEMRLSQKQKKIGLVIFFLVSGTYFIYITITPITTIKIQTKIIYTPQITAPDLNLGDTCKPITK